MNTYFNEITSRPVNTNNSGILYKIPAGAMCANGDLGVVFNDDDKGLLIHISKCDFWKFTEGTHTDGGIKTLGSLRIGNVDLSEYNIKQYFDKGLLDCKFGNTEAELFVAPENLIYFQIKSPESEEFPTVGIEIPDTCNSQNSEFTENDIKCYIRKFIGEEIKLESAMILCLREIDSNTADGFKCTRYCISAVTCFDNSDYTDKGIELALNADYERDKAKTQKKWESFFAASKVTLEDKEIEKF